VWRTLRSRIVWSIITLSVSIHPVKVWGEKKRNSFFIDDVCHDKYNKKGVRTHRDQEAVALGLDLALFAVAPVQIRPPVSAATRLDALDSCRLSRLAGVKEACATGKVNALWWCQYVKAC
jgi:hypothetical protein